MKNTADIVSAARQAKLKMMNSLIALSETNEEREQMEAAKAKLAAMTDAEFLKYHGVAA